MGDMLLLWFSGKLKNKEKLDKTCQLERTHRSSASEVFFEVLQNFMVCSIRNPSENAPLVLQLVNGMKTIDWY